MNTYADTFEDGRDPTSSSAAPGAWKQLPRSARRTGRWIVTRAAGLLREWNRNAMNRHTVIQSSDWELRDIGLVREPMPCTAHKHLWVS